MKHLYAVLSLILVLSTTHAQQKYTLNGFVKDAANGEELIGATVYITQLQNGTVTNAYGFYALTVPTGTYDVSFSFVGYKTQVLTLTISENQSKNIELVSEATFIKEIVITDKPIEE